MGLKEGLYTTFRGYVDDSGDGHQVFTLTCILAKGDNWQWIGLDWKKVLDEKNESLAAQGRKLVRRFHAVDLNNYAEDFEDWTPEERKEFSANLLHVFDKPSNRANGLSYSIELKTLIKLIPETAQDPIGFSYALLLKVLMDEIGDAFSEANRGDISRIKIALIHDRGNYNGVLQEAFQSQLADPTFKYATLFSTLAPMGWEDCLPLQLADFLASEDFKETLRHVSEREKDRGRDRRIPLKELLLSDTFGGFGKCMGEDAIIELRKRMDNKVSRIINAGKEDPDK